MFFKLLLGFTIVFVVVALFIKFLEFMVEDVADHLIYKRKMQKRVANSIVMSFCLFLIGVMFIGVVSFFYERYAVILEQSSIEQEQEKTIKEEHYYIVKEYDEGFELKKLYKATEILSSEDNKLIFKDEESNTRTIYSINCKNIEQVEIKNYETWRQYSEQ